MPVQRSKRPSASAADPFSLPRLNALQFPTPFFLFDLDRVRREVERLRDALPEFRLFYAMKTGALPEVLKAVREARCGFAATSAGEVEALVSAGIPMDEVLFVTPVKSPEQIASAHRAGVRRFAIDSHQELLKLAHGAPGAGVFVRLRVGSGADAVGTPAPDASDLLRSAIRLGLEPDGLSFHVGTQCTRAAAWEGAIREAGQVMSELARYGVWIHSLNVGGGYPARYSGDEPSLEEIGVAIRRAVRRHLPYEVELRAEPGRALVAASAVLAASVIGRSERGRETWLHLDAGAFNALAEARDSERRPDLPFRSSRDLRPGKHRHRYTVSGPLGIGPDVLRRGVPLADDLALGDRIYVDLAGAYSACLTSTFGGFAPVPSYFVRPK